MDFLTRENITLFLSIVGALGTLCSAISSILKNRKNINIQIAKLYKLNNIIWLYILLENKSRTAISINRISLCLSDKVISASQISKKIHKVDITSAGKTTSSKTDYSIAFPIYLPELGCSSGYLYFVLPPEAAKNFPTELTFQVGTNRGKVTQKKLAYELVSNPEELY